MRLSTPKDAFMASVLANTLPNKCVKARCGSMSLKPKDSTQAQLKQLWGGFVPSLTPEQIDLSIQLWEKIKARRKLEQNLKSEKEPLEAPVKPRNQH